MDSFYILFSIIFFLHIGIYDGSTIECYRCVDPQSGCNDPFDKYTNSIEKVPSESGWCWKAKLEIVGKNLVERGTDAIPTATGSFKCSLNKCLTGKYNEIGATLCCCNTNLCNGAQKMVIPGAMIIMILMIHLFGY